MKNNLFIRVCMVVLAMFMVVCLLVACGKKEETKGNEDFDKVVDDSGREEAIENPNIAPVDYKGYEFNFICQPYFDSQAYSVEYMVAESGSSNVLTEAIYKRNAALESKYKIKIGQIRSTDLLGDVRAQVMAGNANFDVIVANCQRLSTLARENLLLDLKKIDRFNMNATYWDSNAAEQLLIGESLYFTNCEFNVQELAFVVYFNKQLVKEYNLSDPYKLIEEDNWTYETWSQMVKGVSKDLDGNGTWNEFDQYGQLTENHNPRMFLYGFGIRATTNDETGKPVDTLISDKTVDAYEKLKAIFADNSVSWNITTDMPNSVTGGYNDKWDYARSLFCLDHYLFHYEGTNIIAQFQNMESPFGILPFPKYDKTQKNFKSLYPYMCNMVAMPNTLQGDALDRAANIFEDMNFLSALYVEPAWYEVLLQRRYAPDDESQQNLITVKAGRVYDIGLYYNFGGITREVLDQDIRKANLSRNYKRQEKMIQSDISKIYRDFGFN